MATENKDLYYLHELTDYKVAKNYADIRGWEVRDLDNRTIGKVDGLLVSKSAEKVVYLDVEVDEAIIEAGHEVYAARADGVHEFLNKEGENHLIIPIGLVNINGKEKLIHSNEITHGTFSKARRFSKGASIGRQYELLLYDYYLPEAKERLAEDQDLYNRKGFEDTNENY